MPLGAAFFPSLLPFPFLFPFLFLGGFPSLWEGIKGRAIQILLEIFVLASAKSSIITKFVWIQPGVQGPPWAEDGNLTKSFSYPPPFLSPFPLPISGTLFCPIGDTVTRFGSQCVASYFVESLLVFLWLSVPLPRCLFLGASLSSGALRPPLGVSPQRGERFPRPRGVHNSGLCQSLFETICLGPQKMLGCFYGLPSVGGASVGDTTSDTGERSLLWTLGELA